MGKNEIETHFIFGNAVRMESSAPYLFKLSVRKDGDSGGCHPYAILYIDVVFMSGEMKIENSTKIAVYGSDFFADECYRKDLFFKLLPGFTEEEKKALSFFLSEKLEKDKEVKEEDLVKKICALKGEEY